MGAAHHPPTFRQGGLVRFVLANRLDVVELVGRFPPGGIEGMTADQYVESVLAKYAVPQGSSSPAEQLGVVVAGPLRSWANRYLHALQYSGSYAKKTGVHGISDVDIFISLKSDAPGTLKELYNQLYRFANEQGWWPRQQNVSVGVTINGTRGDLVPGKLQAGYQNYHSVYLRKSDSWTQTNVALHIDTVRNSGRLREIGQRRSGAFSAASTFHLCISNCSQSRRSPGVRGRPWRRTSSTS